MPEKPFVIIEAPSNLGLAAPAGGGEPGVHLLPGALRAAGFHGRVSPAWTIDVPALPWQQAIDPESGVLNAVEVAAYSRALAPSVQAAVRSGFAPVILGGDCSILLGSMIGLRTCGRYGLFFLDGHTDYQSPTRSATKAVAGMDLAFACGYGPDVLSDIGGLKPYVEPKHVFAVGNRETDSGYISEIRGSAITYIDLPSARNTGADHIVRTFLQMAEHEKLDGFFLHLDADVLDPAIMPAVDSPDPGGFSYTELEAFLRPLLASPRFAGMEMTILDPARDDTGQVVRTFSGHIAGLLAQSRNMV